MARPKVDPAPCRHCGETNRLVGRGLCVYCYNRLRRRGKLDELYPLKKKQAVPQKETVSLPESSPQQPADSGQSTPVLRRHDQALTPQDDAVIAVTFTIRAPDADTLCRMIRDELDWILARI